MNSGLSLPQNDDLEGLMLQVARSIAMGIYELPAILASFDLTVQQFDKWKENPLFLRYLKAETQAWETAGNAPERTKLKASIVLEQFMEEAHASLHDRKTPLNQRVELGKLLAKISGMGEPKVIGGGSSGPGFMLQINIGPGVSERVVIQPQVTNVIEYDDYTPSDDGYDPFTSPTTLDD